MNEKKKNILDNGSKATEGSDQSISRSVSSAARESSKSLEKSLTTLSWLVTVNVDELRKKHEKEDKGSFIKLTAQEQQIFCLANMMTGPSGG